VYKPYQQEIRAVGFKLMYTQAKYGRASRVWTWLSGNPNVKIIHLKRTNLLASYVSMLLTVKTHLFMATSAAQVHPTRLTINPEDCRKYFIVVSAQQQYYDHFFQNNDMLSVTYENLASNREKQTSAMLLFLKLPQTQLTSSLIKLNSSPLSYTIKNYKSLKQRFQKTEWSRFFSE
jgi:LPS sulfotransferase NodH